MSKEINIIVDGIIYQMQSHGGISRIYNEIFPRMCSQNEALKITILTTNRLKQPLPEHECICNHRLFPIEAFLFPKRLWRPMVNPIRTHLQKWAIRKKEGHMWHSTYYTRLKGWDGKEVVTVYDMIHERYREIYDQYYQPGYDMLRKRKQECVQNADAVICISATTQRDLERYYGIDPAKIYVIPLAHSHEFMEMNLDASLDILPIDKPFLLYVGKRRRYKNFDLLLKGYSVWSQRKDIDLVVAGRPWTEDEQRALEEMDIADRVHLLISISDRALAQLYHQALALVFPSLYEGFGIPLLEAMACGCPIVASRIPSTLEIAGDIPIYFQPGEIESLLAGLNAVCAEGKDSDRVKTGLEHVKQYSWDRTARQTLQVYDDVANSL